MIRVLIVDDSALVRKALSVGLSKARDIEVVGTATDPYDARDKIVALEPDVVTLDINMPRMDGLSFLAKLMKFKPIPVVIVSSIARKDSEIAMRALELGAIDVVEKTGSAHSAPDDVERNLTRAVRGAARARMGVQKACGEASRGDAAPDYTFARADHILAIGASTGGTRALQTLLTRLPANTPGTVIVQHMPENFTKGFAETLDRVSPMTVREASDWEQIEPGVALVAPGGLHMIVRRSAQKLYVRLRNGPPVHFQRPAVDTLFQSVAATMASRATGVLLTGMGADGAAGLLEMRRAGAHTICQDEASCVVFGMPKAAIELGAPAEILPLDGIDRGIIESLGGRSVRVNA